MIYDAGLNLQPGAEISADICIVGSGAAALPLACELIPSGRRIALLESSRFNAHPFRYTPTLSPDSPTMQAAESDTMYGGSVNGVVSQIAPDFLTRTRRRCYGGSTNCWDGWTRPLDAVDFDRRDLGRRCIWPLDRFELIDFYNKAIEYCSLGIWDVSAYDRPDYWRGKTCRAIEPLAHTEKSGLRAGVVAIVSNNGVSGGRLVFQQVWGPRLEEASNVRIYRNAHVRHLDTNGSSGSVRRLIASTTLEGRPGHDFAVQADRYVLAVGGIEAARLLLASDGLGNRHDQVGRSFMVHFVKDRAATFTAGPALTKPVKNYCVGSLLNGDPWPPSVLGIVAPTPDTLKKAGIGDCWARLKSDYTIGLSCEQVSNVNSRITLSDQRDPIFGDPSVHLDWTAAALDDRTMNEGLAFILHGLAMDGYLADFSPASASYALDNHHMGATRMSFNREEGVVDRECRVHGVDNLYIASSSVFPTGGAAPPTLTIVALALRLAQYLAQ